MAKPHIKTHKPKPKFSLFLCCFGSFSQESSMKSDHTPQKKIRWFSWRRTQKIMKSGAKTVPLDASLSGHKGRADHIHSSQSKSKSKATSKSKPQKPSLIKPQSPAINPPLPSQASPVVPVVPNQAPSQTRQGHRAQQNHANNLENGNRSHHMASSEEDTRQESGSSRAMSRTVSLTSSKRQDRSLSSLSMQPQTTLNKLESARRYDPVVGMSAVLVTLVIMILWGRLSAILCTSAWFYFMRRFRMATENDKKDMNTYSTNPDFDSKVYKKKVILEGLLERNHRGTL